MGNGAHLPNQLTLSAALSRSSCTAIMSEATSHLYSRDTSLSVVYLKLFFFILFFFSYSDEQE